MGVWGGGRGGGGARPSASVARSSVSTRRLLRAPTFERSAWLDGRIDSVEKGGSCRSATQREAIAGRTVATGQPQLSRRPGDLTCLRDAPDVRAVRVMMSEFGRDPRCLRSATAVHRDSAALSVPRPCCALALGAPAVSGTGRVLEERQTSSASYGIIPERLWK